MQLPTGPEAELQPTLVKLKGLLKVGNADAGDVICELLGKFEGSSTAKQLDMVFLAIEVFVFCLAQKNTAKLVP